MRLGIVVQAWTDSKFLIRQGTFLRISPDMGTRYVSEHLPISTTSFTGRHSVGDDSSRKMSSSRKRPSDKRNIAIVGKSQGKEQRDCISHVTTSSRNIFLRAQTRPKPTNSRCVIFLRCCREFRLTRVLVQCQARRTRHTPKRVYTREDTILDSRGSCQIPRDGGGGGGGGGASSSQKNKRIERVPQR